MGAFPSHGWSCGAAGWLPMLLLFQHTTFLTAKNGKDIHDEIDLAENCESCLAKGGGWCTIDQRCVEDDTAHCNAESLIGLAGYTMDCNSDEERHKAKIRPRIDKGVLVSYTFENGSCCMGLGIVHRAYHVLEEYTVLLPNSSREEVKTERWNRRSPAKKGKENSEYHDMEFRYFRPWELNLISGIRPNDTVMAHYPVKVKGADLVKSRRAEHAVVINTTVTTLAVNFTSDNVVSVVPRNFVVDLTNLTSSMEPSRAAESEASSAREQSEL